jgi:hypothetical protein
MSSLALIKITAFHSLPFALCMVPSQTLLALTPISVFRLGLGLELVLGLGLGLGLRLGLELGLGLGVRG